MIFLFFFSRTSRPPCVPPSLLFSQAKNKWNHTSTPPIYLHSVDKVGSGDKLTFFLHTCHRVTTQLQLINTIITIINYNEFVRIKLVDFGSHLNKLQEIVKPRNYQRRFTRNAQFELHMSILHIFAIRIIRSDNLDSGVPRNYFRGGFNKFS